MISCTCLPCWNHSKRFCSTAGSSSAGWEANRWPAPHDCRQGGRHLRQRHAGAKPKTPLVVEVDNENEKKDIDALDIEIPVLGPRIYCEYKNLAELDTGAFGHQIAANRSALDIIDYMGKSRTKPRAFRPKTTCIHRTSTLS